MKKPKTERQIKLAPIRSQYEQPKQKKAKSQGEVREMLRLKAVMAYYRGIKIETEVRTHGVTYTLN